MNFRKILKVTVGIAGIAWGTHEIIKKVNSEENNVNDTMKGKKKENVQNIKAIIGNDMNWNSAKEQMEKERKRIIKEMKLEGKNFDKIEKNDSKIVKTNKMKESAANVMETVLGSTRKIKKTNIEEKTKEIGKETKTIFLGKEHIEATKEDLIGESDIEEKEGEVKATVEKKKNNLSFFRTKDIYFSKKYNENKSDKKEEFEIVIDVSVTATPRHISILEEDFIEVIGFIRNIISQMDLEELETFGGRKNAIKKIKKEMANRNFMFKEVYFKKFTIRKEVKETEENSSYEIIEGKEENLV